MPSKCCPSRFSRLEWLGIAAIGILIIFAVRQWPTSDPLYQGRPLDYWIQALSDADNKSSAQAAAILNQIGPESVPILKRIVQGKESGLKIQARNLAVKLRLLNAPNYDLAFVQGTAVYLLGQIGPASEPATPALIALLPANDPQIRIKTVQALSKIGLGAVPWLVQALRHPDPMARRGASEALGKIGAPATSAIPTLRQNLLDSDPDVRLESLHALQRIDPGKDYSLFAK